MSGTPEKTQLPANVLPLDAIRFLAALWVCLYHGVKPPGNRIIPFFDLGWDAMLFGGTGVLAFFVISGFCIHYPAAARAAHSPWGAFLTRRLVRVLIPYFAILPFAYWTGRDYRLLYGNDLAWTILCDLAYYALYPLFYYAARAAGWTVVLLGSLVLSGVSMAANIYVWIDIGNAILIPIFMPVWVLGCVLAERFVRSAKAGALRIPSTAYVWVIRAAIILFTPVLGILSFYKIIYWIYLGVPFGFFVTYWLWVEIRYFSTGRTVVPLLAWAGAWIYSLYLTHPITQRGIDIVMQTYFPEADQFMHSHFIWLSIRFVVMVTATFVAAYVFARLVEWPGHQLARWLSRRVKF